MGGSQKSKRVTWASDVNLCQVKLFLSEDSPSQVGIGTQDHLQAKAFWSVQTGGVGSYDNLPPGFEGVQPANPWTAKLSQICLIKWKCPPRFVVNTDWQVVAGDESLEIETQNQREMRVLEAIYPRSSAIPPNPSTLPGVEDQTNNDQHTPVVPITPIEDEDAAIDTSYASTNPMTSHQHSSHVTFSSQGSSPIINPQQPNGISAIGVEPDIVAAAQAALTSVMSNSGQGNNNLIDRGLLIKILSDPKMIEQLITNRNASSSVSQNVPSSSLQVMPAVGSKNPVLSGTPSSSMHNNVPSTSSMHYLPNLRSSQNNPFNPVNVAVNRVDPPLSLAANSRQMPPGPFYPPRPVHDAIPAPSPSIIGTPLTKDINYYKSLIQQHGGERRESSMPPQFGHQASQEHLNVMMKGRESKPKIMKPCIYFNSSKGCRNGADCLYQHDISAQQRAGGGIPEVQSAKRARVDSEITANESRREAAVTSTPCFHILMNGSNAMQLKRHQKRRGDDEKTL